MLRAGTALGILIIATAQANAGAFAIREQSTYGQGTSFAGVAAGGSLSSMYWNPATLTQFKGIVNESGFSIIIPHVAQTPLAGSTLAGPPLFYRGVSNSGDNALVPNGYTSYQISPNLWLGLGINAPFGLSVSFQDPWAGRNYGLDTTIKTYNLNPNIAYRINDWISIGVGVQAQYASIRQTTGLAPFPPSSFVVDSKGWASARPRCDAHAVAKHDDRTRVALGDQSGHPRHHAIARRGSRHARFGRGHDQPARYRQPWHPSPV
jgi:long-subunit fatty acid transport protein